MKRQPNPGTRPASKFALLALILASFVASAESDLRLAPITDDVYALVGDIGNRSPANLGNNATFGLVVTSAGAVLIDPGGSRAGARRIQRAIEQVTDQPVIKVINTGGQDHRWLGNAYFAERGADIIASDAAVTDQVNRARDQFIALNALIGEDGAAGTEAVHANIRFADAYRFTLGDTDFEIYHAGPAHTPGDSFVWLPRQGIVFTGDIVYVERLLGITAESASAHWIEAFVRIAALEPRHVVPGHGAPTDLDRARRETYDYLVFLREKVGAFIDAGNDLSQIGEIDQSRFGYLANFDSLSGRNAQQVFTEMEWE